MINERLKNIVSEFDTYENMIYELLLIICRTVANLHFVKYIMYIINVYLFNDVIRRQNVRSAKCLSAKCLSAKCLSAKSLSAKCPATAWLVNVRHYLLVDNFSKWP